MHLSRGTLGALAVLIAAAVLEVAGYALIRKGMGGDGLALIGLGFMVLCSYRAMICPAEREEFVDKIWSRSFEQGETSDRARATGA